MNEKVLEQAGLTKTESKVYLAVLELGTALAGTISRKSGLHRRSVYDAVERLIQKGLISYIKTNNRHYFEAVEPKRLLEIVKEKQESIYSIMPELELKYSMSKEKQETIFYKGKQALKSVFDDQIKEAKEILVLGAATNAPEIVKYYFPKYDKERTEKNIQIKAIFNEKIKQKIPLIEIRYLPKEFSSHTAINIYADKVAIILWEENPFAILIKNKSIAESYRKYFSLMWNIAKE